MTLPSLGRAKEMLVSRQVYRAGISNLHLHLQASDEELHLLLCLGCVSCRVARFGTGFVFVFDD